ncbi:MAG: glucokinase, partial [Acidobacteriota bacterium]
ARVHDALLAGTDRRPHPDLTIAVDRSAAVARLAGDGGCALCARAADLWLRCLARRAGDLALTYLARGGIVLGGVAAHWLPQLRQLAFREAVRGHSPMRELLAEIPIRVVVADDAALRGAARHALHRLDAAP